MSACAEIGPPGGKYERPELSLFGIVLNLPSWKEVQRQKRIRSLSLNIAELCNPEGGDHLTADQTGSFTADQTGSFAADQTGLDYTADKLSETSFLLLMFVGLLQTCQSNRANFFELNQLLL